MIDLMTVLLLTVMALIARDGRPAKPVGVVERAFVMVSGEVIAAPNGLQSAAWRDGDFAFISLDGLAEIVALTPTERRSDGMFATLVYQPQPQATVVFSSFRSSVFEEPESSVLEIASAGPATLKCSVIGLEGRPEELSFEIEEGGSYEFIFTSTRVGNGVTTTVARRELL